MRAVEASAFTRVLRNAGWLVAAVPLTFGLGVAQVAMTGRLLGPEGMGVLGLMLAVRTLVGTALGSTSLEALAVMGAKDLAANQPNLAARSLLQCGAADVSTSCAAALVFILVWPLVGNSSQVAVVSLPAIALYSLSLPLAAGFGVAQAGLRLFERFRLASAAGLALSAFKTLFLGVAAFLQPTLTGIVGALAAGDALALVCAALVVKHCAERRGVSAWRLELSFSRELRDLLLSAYFRQAIKGLSRFLDTLVLAKCVGTAELGHYRAARQMSEQTQVPAGFLQASLLPEYGRAYVSSGIASIRRLCLRSMAFLAAIGGPVLLAAWALREFVIEAVLGKAFLPAADLLPGLLVGTFMLFLVSPLLNLPSVLGRPSLSTWANVSAAGFQGVALLILVPPFGSSGAAWSQVAYIAGWSLVGVPFLWRRLAESQSARSGV